MKKTKDIEIEDIQRYIIPYFIVCAFIISYPFFAFDYFETHKALAFVTKYCLPPILIITIPGVPYIYSKYVSKYDKIIYERNLKKTGKKPLNKTISMISKYSMYFFLILMISGILFGICYSSIITTNAYLGISKKVMINEKILDYQTRSDRGTIKHYIKFNSPTDKKIIELQVYKRDLNGDYFKKEMKVGYWGILYCKK